jgi:NADPH-dependent 2,4-dienoyl-CoA reductase/sulfur reductase-like enzyme
VAGHRAAIELRRLRPEAAITVMAGEESLPYDRPTLTKELLLANKTAAEIVLKDADRYAELGISYLRGTWAEGIDTREGVVEAGLQRIPYDTLLLATGSRARRLPIGLDAGGGLYIRTLADALRLRAQLLKGRRVVIIGAGFIGLEVAAAARKAGCSVTVVEAKSTVLSRGMPEPVSQFMQGLHVTNGVEFRFGTLIGAIDWTSDGSALVELAHETLRADVVVFGLGIEPNVELARQAGLDVRDGIVVDAQCRTSAAEIFAAGEVTSHPSGPHGTHRRIESWRVASDQPLVAAANMADGEASYTDAPWLWSDQYDVNLQCIGDVLNGTVYLQRGDPATHKWTLIALDDAGLPLGGVAINNGRDISMLRRAIVNGTPIPDVLASECVRLPSSHANSDILSGPLRVSS